MKLIVRIAITGCLLLGLVFPAAPYPLSSLAMAGENPSQSPAGSNSPVPKKQLLRTIIVDNYYPYTFVNQQGQVDGYSVDLARAVATVMGFELDIRPGSWSEALQTLQEGEIDFLPMMAYSKERGKSFDFTEPHTIAHDAFFYVEGRSRPETLADLKGKTVIVMKNDAAHDYLLSQGIAKPGNILLVESLPDALRQLSLGKGDAALMPKLVGLLLIKHLKLNNIELSPIVVKDYSRPFSFAVREGNRELLDLFTEGLSIVKATGEYEQIHRKWFAGVESDEVTLRAVMKYIILAAAVFSGVVLVVSLWSLSLKRRVARRTKELQQEVEERKRAEESLRESLAINRAILESIPQKLFLKDRDSIYLTVNKPYAISLGQVPEQIIGKDDFAFFPTELARKYRADDQEVMQSGQGKDFEEAFLAGGKDYVVRTIKVPVRNSAGAVTALLGIFEDITERKQAEEEKVKLLERLNQAQKMEAIGILAGEIAHDFNNILGVILGYTEMAIEDAPPDSRFANDLDRVLTSAHQAKDLVRQILAFSRQTNVSRFALNIQPLVKESLKLLRASIPSTIAIKEDISPGHAIINADPTQIHQIVMNLCTNAFHAMEMNGGELSVEVNTVSLSTPTTLFDGQELDAGEYVALTVSDTGTGIGPDIIGKIFDPYFTTKGPGRGTGMGLSIIHGIVTGYQGVITVKSTLGQGTTFCVYLPTVRENAEPPVASQAPPGGRERILFVDDEDLLAEMGKDMLERLGYTVTAFSRSVEALKAFADHPEDFDLVITDQTMPDLTGTELAKRLLAIRADLPIILCTGHSNLVDEESAPAIGIKKFALKPLTKSRIGQLVREALNGTSAG